MSANDDKPECPRSATRRKKSSRAELEAEIARLRAENETQSRDLIGLRAKVETLEKLVGGMLAAPPLGPQLIPFPVPAPMPAPHPIIPSPFPPIQPLIPPYQPWWQIPSDHTITCFGAERDLAPRAAGLGATVVHSGFVPANTAGCAAGAAFVYNNAAIGPSGHVTMH